MTHTDAKSTFYVHYKNAYILSYKTFYFSCQIKEPRSEYSEQIPAFSFNY